MHLKKVLKKYGQEPIERDVHSWCENGPGSPGALKKRYIEAFSDDAIDDQGNADEYFYEKIDLKDPVTWGNVPDMPGDEFFLALYKAIKADEKRAASRKSYEF